MKRLGALVLSIALVGGAVLVSRAVWGTDTASDTDPTDTTRPDGTIERLKVVCATEFADACAQLAENADIDARAEFRTEVPGATVKALTVDPTPDFDLWITSTPWPDLARAKNARLGRPGAPFAQTQVALVTKRDRAADLTANCGAPEVSWQCLLRQNGRRLPDGAPVRFGVAPADSTAGLIALGSFVQGFPDIVDSTDLEVNDDFQSVFSNVKSSAVDDPTPLQTMLRLPRFSVAADVGTDAQLTRAADGSQYRVLVRGALARAVAVPAATERGRAALDRIGAGNVRAAIRGDGWVAPTGADDGLPQLDVLDSLLNDWSKK